MTRMGDRGTFSTLGPAVRGDAAEESRMVSAAVAAAQRGDRDGIRYLYARYADDVYGFVRSMVRGVHDAEDVTQHVFAKLITSIHMYEPREVPFKAWILRVARNAALDRLRSKQALPVEEVRPAESPLPAAERDLPEALRCALAGLPADQREVVVLRHLLGLSPGEIARRLGKSEGAVHGLHHRGRRSLKAALADLGAAPATR